VDGSAGVPIENQGKNAKAKHHASGEEEYEKFSEQDKGWSLMDSSGVSEDTGYRSSTWISKQVTTTVHREIEQN